MTTTAILALDAFYAGLLAYLWVVVRMAARRRRECDEHRIDSAAHRIAAERRP